MTESKSLKTERDGEIGCCGCSKRCADVLGGGPNGLGRLALGRFELYISRNSRRCDGFW